MRKILLISIVALSILFINKSINAQSQRLVLFEEFTQASCSACGAYNPALNVLLSANSTKVVSLKYQVNWPGTDVMNLQNPTQVATRVSYYSVSGVPDGEEDGNVFNDNPANFTQAKINTEYAVASPFDMNLTHTFNAAYDSVFITCKIKCTQAVTVTGPMKCHIALVEKQIHFASAPGTNGETDFYNVMRKMYPSDQGTTLSNTWAVGDSLIINIAAKLPTYIYDKEQLAVVSFIQDNSNKNVKQAAYSIPQQMPIDASITTLSNVPPMQCIEDFTPTATLKNIGSTTITTATINYKIDNGTVKTMPWTGSLTSGSSIVVTLPSDTSTTGSHTFSVYVTLPNGITDANPNNDKQSAQFAISLTPTGALIPLSEGFESTAVPPANWLIINPSNGATWVRKSVGGFGHSTHSFEIDCYSIADGVTNDLIVAPIDLSTATRALMTFSIAHARFGSYYTDELQVLVSTDCGTTWHNVYDKSDPSLATAIDTANAFTPTAAQWRTDTINLNAYLGQSKVYVNFHSISGYGNNLYLDDINISQTVGINELENKDINLNIYPDPAKESITIESPLMTNDGTIKVYNIQGQLMLEQPMLQIQTVINISGFAKGVYFVRIIGNGINASKKIVKD